MEMVLAFYNNEKPASQTVEITDGLYLILQQVWLQLRLILNRVQGNVMFLIKS